MEVLKNIFLILILLFSNEAYSRQVFDIQEVQVDCNNEEICDGFGSLTRSLKGKKISVNLIKKKIDFILNDNRISKLSYQILERNKVLILKFSVETKLKVSRIEHESNVDIPFSKILSFLTIKEGSYFNPEYLPESRDILMKQLEDKGYGDISIDFKLEKRKQSLDIKVLITINKIIKLKNVIIKSQQGEDLNRFYRAKFNQFINESWDNVKFKVAVDELSKELLKEGHFFSSVKSKYQKVIEDSITAEIEVFRGPRVNFSFSGHHILSRKALIKPIIEKMKGSIDFISNSDVKEIINKQYIKKGIYHSKVSIRVQQGKLLSNINYRNYFINIKEGQKLPVKEIIYKGNIEKNVKELRDFYYSKATTLALRDYLDEDFVKSFPELLKRYYLERGFVSAEISKPIIQIDLLESNAKVIFKIIERQQVLIEKINFLNVPEIVAKKVLKEVNLREGAPLNIVTLGDQLQKVLQLVREQGYFYAQFTNINQSDLVQYNGSRNKAILNFKFELKQKTVFEDVLITGNVKTKNQVIRREIKLIKNEVITPKKLEAIKIKLSSLGLFSLIRISPYLLTTKTDGESYKANVLIQVREKEFGYGEFAPGYRTDLGVKASITINYNNTLGLHHTNSLKIQTNQRLDSSTIDENRRELYNKELEYLLKWNYNWPYFLTTEFDFDFTSTIQRRRYFGFDADILRVGPKLTRDLGEHVTVSLKYQFETISQFNATASKDADYYRIGSISPSINIDLRDNVINPRSGAYFGLSLEVATPGLQSLRDEDIEVNYMKLISRNKFYVSKGKWTFALSVSAGIEKNNAKNLKFDADGVAVFNDDGSRATIGFIPSIKVFRLDGVDTVRGYTDTEINLVDNARDIGELIIQNKAYFINFKFEPRYLLSDNFMWGVFFDAGRVFVNNFKPLDLRTSTGLTFKLLTPVGSLDFDYGIKLKRNLTPTADRESFGRFHLSIGYF